MGSGMNRAISADPDTEILRASAGQIVECIASGKWSSLEVTETFIRQIESVSPDINALVVSRFE